MSPSSVAAAGRWVPSASQEEVAGWMTRVLDGVAWPGDRGKVDDLLPEGVLAAVFQEIPTLAGRGWFLEAMVGLLDRLGSPEPPALGREGIDNLLLLTARVAVGTEHAAAAGRAVDRLLREPGLGWARVRILQTLLSLGEHRDASFWLRHHDRDDDASTTVVAGALFSESAGDGFAFLARPEVGPARAVSLLERLMPRVRRTRSAEAIWTSPDALRLLASLPPELVARARAVLPPMPEQLGTLEDLSRAVARLKARAAREERLLLAGASRGRGAQPALFEDVGPNPADVN